MSEKTVLDDYFGGGNGEYFRPGINKGVRVKSWTLESKESDGKTNMYILVTYTKPNPGEDNSEIRELLSFPTPRMGETSVNKDGLRYGFINPLKAFILNFAAEDQVKERFAAVLQKLNIPDFTFDNVSTLYKELSTLVKAWFDLAEKAHMYSVEGVLVCGYKSPSVYKGELKQFLTPAPYGISKCYKPAFRTNGDEELPSENTVFSDEKTKKYNYWGYKKESLNVENVANPSNDSVEDTGGW